MSNTGLFEDTLKYLGEMSDNGSQVAHGLEGRWQAFLDDLHDTESALLKTSRMSVAISKGAPEKRVELINEGLKPLVELARLIGDMK